MADAEENVKQLVRDDKVSADVAINLLVECKGTERDVYAELMASLDEAVKAGKTKITAKFVKSKKVNIKPKVIRETFNSLLPASSQIREQFALNQSQPDGSAQQIKIALPADAARKILSILEEYESLDNVGNEASEVDKSE